MQFMVLGTGWHLRISALLKMLAKRLRPDSGKRSAGAMNAPAGDSVGNQKRGVLDEISPEGTRLSFRREGGGELLSYLAGAGWLEQRAPSKPVSLSGGLVGPPPLAQATIL